MPFIIIGHGTICALIQPQEAPKVGNEILVVQEDLVAANVGGRDLVGTRVILTLHEPSTFKTKHYGEVRWFNIAGNLRKVVPPPV